MAIPGKSQQTVTRAVMSYTQGTGTFMPPVSSSATAPSQSTPASTPHPIIVNGSDSQNQTIGIGKLTAGASTTITAVIQLPNLPTFTPSTSQAQSSLVTRFGDIVSFVASMQVSNAIAGLAIQSFSCKPQAMSGGQTFIGPTFPGGQVYTSFSVAVTVTVLATVATIAGNIVVTANGQLVVQQG